MCKYFPKFFCAHIFYPADPISIRRVIHSSLTIALYCIREATHTSASEYVCTQYICMCASLEPLNCANHCVFYYK